MGAVFRHAGLLSLLGKRNGHGIRFLRHPFTIHSFLYALWQRFTGLDPQAASRMQELLLDLNTKGTTIMICDHQLSNLLPIATHYGVLTEGVLVTEISAKQIIENQIDLDRDYLHMAEV